MYFDIRDWVEGADNEDALISKIHSLNLNLSDKTTIAFRNNYVNYFGRASKQTVDFLAETLK